MFENIKHLTPGVWARLTWTITDALNRYNGMLEGCGTIHAALDHPEGMWGGTSDVEVGWWVFPQPQPYKGVMSRINDVINIKFTADSGQARRLFETIERGSR